MEIGDHRADDPRHGAAVRREFGDGVEAVLRPVGLGLGARGGIVDQLDAANTPALGTGRGQAAIEIDGLMDAVEIAQAEMHDAGGDGVAVIGGDEDRGPEIAERGGVELDRRRCHRRAPCWFEAE